MTPAQTPPQAPPDAGPAIAFHRRRLLVDGTPTLSFSGEVHYFRLDRADWPARLDQLVAAGCDTVATYMPWLWHELPDGSVDLTGATHERRDLVGFLDLAAAMGLKVIARPGPFVMAELKNEGIPFRVYDKTPEVWPTTWEGRQIPTRTIDYLAPAFLEATRGWFAEIMPLLAERQWSRGGPVVGVQLDNEIGMLSWVSNSPDLTDLVCEDMRAWVRGRYGDQLAGERAGVDVADPVAWAARLRSPDPDQALPLHHDLGLYMRDRFRRYVDALVGQAEELGVTDVPFYINVHGTGGGRGRTFPVGISQLFESYRGRPRTTSGSDFYLGDLTVGNLPDLYTSNAFLAAVHDADQPLTSLEFEGGTGDYGEDLSTLSPPEAVALKTRLSVAQGNRLINYYLFCGGTNPALDEPVGDGNDRIAFTGERHGFASPVDPEGQETPAYASLRDTVTALRAVGPLLADSDEEDDGLALGFVADHYLTEYAHEASTERAEQVADLERFRGMGPREVLARALLLCGTSFPAVDLQSDGLDPATTPVLALAGASTMAAEVQERIADYVSAGGRLLLSGVLPVRDHEGRPCRVLAERLGLQETGRVEHVDTRYYPSVVAHGWAAPRAEARVGYAQLLDTAAATNAVPLLVEKQSGATTAVQVEAGAGRAVVVACDYPCHLDFWRAALDALGVTPRVRHDVARPGLAVTTTVDPRGQRLLHLVNVGPVPVDGRLTVLGEPFAGGRRLHVPARTGLVLPAGIDLDGARLVAATTEVVELATDHVVLRPTQPDGDVVLLETDRPVTTTRGDVATGDGRTTVTFPPGDTTPATVRLG